MLMAMVKWASLMIRSLDAIFSFCEMYNAHTMIGFNSTTHEIAEQCSCWFYSSLV